MKKELTLIVGTLSMLCSNVFANLNSVSGTNDSMSSDLNTIKYIFIRLFILLILGGYSYLYVKFERVLLKKAAKEGKINKGLYFLIIISIVVLSCFSIILGILALIGYIKEVEKTNKALKKGEPIPESFGFTGCFVLVMGYFALIVLISFTWGDNLF